jgi:DNA-3-methyladenine glycosylase II
MLKISCQADVDRDIELLIKQDPRLANVLNAVMTDLDNIPLRLREGGFAGLAHIVVGQLLSVASASAISKRLTSLVSPLNAENYLATDRQLLLDCGLSNSKYTTLQGIAQAQVANEFDFEQLYHLDAAQALKCLCAFKGIGPWTAEVYLLFCMGHRDIFPAGDLALRKAVEAALDLEATPSIKAVNELSEQWAPYRGSAARLFWAYYAWLKKREGIS